MSYLVLDLETVPGEVPFEPKKSELARVIEAVTRYKRKHETDLTLADCERDDVVLKVLDESFPPPACWRIACAACVLLEDDLSFIKMGTLGNKKRAVISDESSYLFFGEELERQIVCDLAGLVERKGVTLVTYNGRRFDVPVFEARCFRFGVPLPTFANAWRYRYGEDRHLDLLDDLSGYGSAPASKLDYVSQLIGLPGKPPDTDGSKVSEMIAAGRLKDVEAYCLSDVAQTAGVLIRRMVFRGRLTISEGQKACLRLLEAMEKDERVRWVAERTNRKVFLIDQGGSLGSDAEGGVSEGGA